MRIECVGGGPGGLYFALLAKKADPSREIVVRERHHPSDTFGFGVVFSDATMENLREADPESWDEVTRHFHRWDDIHVHYRGELLTSTGHGFAGLARRTLLDVLGARCVELGVDLRTEAEVADVDALRDADLVVAADGVHSATRERWAERFRPSVDLRPNRFVWLGTTRPFPAFTFYFRENEHGLWRVHAYQYERDRSTFIVETTEETFRASGLAVEDEAATVAYCEALFANELEGHRLVTNRSVWRRFPTIRNERWSWENVVLLGDAVHTAHFSIGSGTKLALEDAIALAGALDSTPDLPAALAAYEAERRGPVESLQRAAHVSLQWFEDTERWMDTEPIQFGFNLLTRSLRITHEDLRARDPATVEALDRWYATRAAEAVGDPSPSPDAPAPPPMFTPFRLRSLRLENRVVVSPMCQYRATDGVPGDWHLAHYGARAIGGAGLLFTEMTDVSADARITPGCAGLWNATQLDAWRRIVDFVHGESRAKIALQLGHAGRKGSARVPWEADDAPLADGAWETIAPSAIPWRAGWPAPRAMTRDDMDRVVEDFVRSAELAVAAGFDLLEIHFAHGYLLGSFVSPLTNRREDEYGGPLANRLRYPLEVFDAVRAAWPDERPMSVRISAVDWALGGLEPKDAVQVARALGEHGCDLVDVSAGQTVPEARPAYGRQFQTPFSDRIRHETGLATMAVGNISSSMDVNTILAAGRADLCALARAHLWDPHWTRNAASELGWKAPWPDPYAVLDGYSPRFR